MRFKLLTQFFLALFLSLLAILAAVMATVQWSFRHGFEDYLVQVEARRMERLAGLLESAYGEAGSWDFLRANQPRWFALLREAGGAGEDPHAHRGFQPALPDVPAAGREPPADRPDGAPRPPPFWDGEDGGPPGRSPFPAPEGRDFPPPPHPHGPPPQGELFRNGHLRVLDAEKRQVVGPPHGVEAAAEILQPIRRGGTTVGWLGFSPRRVVADELEAAYIRRITAANILILGLVLLLAAGVSLFLARLFVRPLRRLAAAARALAAGDFAVAIPTGRSDELGQLAQDFNALADTLRRNEAARRQWVADTSHEMRTPLAILRSELEALLDGVRQPTPERLKSLHAEVLGMGKLVDDLYELAVYDLGAMRHHPEPLNLAELAGDAADSFRPRFEAAGLRLESPLPAAAGPVVNGDAGRLRQLLGNLLENSLRYTDAGGHCRVAVTAMAGRAVLTVEDSAPGVPDGDLGRLFERFYRADKSRSRARGGAGLGLALCRQIAEAHNGRLAAFHSSLGGLGIRLELPVSGA